MVLKYQTWDKTAGNLRKGSSNKRIKVSKIGIEMAIQCLQSTHEKAQLEWVKNNSNLTK